MRLSTSTTPLMIKAPPMQRSDAEIELQVTRYFHMTCELVGLSEAIAIFDRYGCNSDETYPTKVELAEWIYAELLDREIKERIR